jgi:hypothetical protein
MKVYQISYTLRKQRNYSGLYKRIHSYGTYCHPLESSWLIVTNQSAMQIRDFLIQAMDPDDSLLITRLQGEAVWEELGEKLSQWLKKQLSPHIA